MPYKENETHGPNFPQPPPDLIEGEEEWEIEAILNHRKARNGRGRDYFVKWKDYPTSFNQWLKPNQLKNAAEMLDEYKKAKKLR